VVEAKAHRTLDQDKPHLWVVAVHNSLKARGWFAVRMWSAVRNKFGGSCQAGRR
jgi:hypothetical protein